MSQHATTEAPRCSACRGRCRWVEDAWVCTKCGSEWNLDHDPERFAPPAGVEMPDKSNWMSLDGLYPANATYLQPPEQMGLEEPRV